jgi:hypothetical protein
MLLRATPPPSLPEGCYRGGSGRLELMTHHQVHWHPPAKS